MASPAQIELQAEEKDLRGEYEALDQGEGPDVESHEVAQARSGTDSFLRIDSPPFIVDAVFRESPDD